MSRTEETLGGDATAVDGERIAPIVGPRPGSSVGRYVLQEKIGAGGMGVVFRARDPKLDREVAIKIIAPDRLTGDRDRRLREARALAAVSHPNVVAVLDVGTYEGTVFVAMELVETGTLRTWLQSAPRSQAQRLEMLRDAGEGLEAAHRAGVIHGDFKPDNVLIGSDGRARVGDFGLASLGEASTVSGPVGDGSATTAHGTPAYMAPELYAGARTTVSSDVFALCVTAYEVLCDVKPFGSTGGEVTFAMTHREFAPPQSDPPPRPAILSSVRRGLSRDPGQRWETVSGLLAAWRPRRFTAVWLAAAVSVSASAVAFTVWATGEERACEREPATTNWTEARRASVAQAFSDARARVGDATYSRVEKRIDDYVAEWDAAYQQACESGADDVVRDRAIVCLRERLEALEATLDTFENADAATVTASISAALRLRDPAECNNLADEDAEDDAIDSQSKRALARGSALIDANDLEGAARLGHALVVSARQSGNRHLEARALLLEGLATHAGQQFQSSPVFERAHELSVAVGDDRTATQAATKAGMLEAHEGSLETAQWWERHATSSIARTRSDARLAVRLAHLQIEIAHRRGDHAAERAQAMAASSLADGAGPEEIATVTFLRARAHLEAKEFAEAAREAERGLRERRETFGEKHPITGISLLQLSEIASIAGDHPRAAELLDQALEIVGHEQGYQRLRSDGLLLKADVARARGDLKTALAAVEEVEGMLENVERATLSHANVATHKAFIAAAQGDLDTALTEFRRAEAIAIELSGFLSPYAAAAAVQLAGAYANAKRPAVALELARSANGPLHAPGYSLKGNATQLDVMLAVLETIAGDKDNAKAALARADPEHFPVSLKNSLVCYCAIVRQTLDHELERATSDIDSIRRAELNDDAKRCIEAYDRKLGPTALLGE